MSEQVICMQWQSSVMPVPAFDYFHADCFTGQAERFPNGRIRYVPIHEVGMSAICSGCWEYIREKKEA